MPQIADFSDFLGSRYYDTLNLKIAKTLLGNRVSAFSPYIFRKLKKYKKCIVNAYDSCKKCIKQNSVA